MGEFDIVKMENARGEILSTICNIQNKYCFSSCIIDSILAQLLSEVRQEEKIELINASNKIVVQLKQENENLKQKIEKKEDKDDKLDG